MNTFTEYVVDKEELEYLKEQEQLDEVVLLAAAGTVLGVAAAGLFVAWGTSLLVRGWIKVITRAVVGLKKYWKMMRKGKSNTDINPQGANNMMRKAKVDQRAKTMGKDDDRILVQYEEELKELRAAIKSKEPEATTEAWNNIDKSLQSNPKVLRAVLAEIVKVMKEPPLHFGTTGNKTYLFIKKVFGIKVAQATATAVKAALQKHGPELLDGSKENQENDEEEIEEKP